jgi:hypothetical protein
MQTSASTSNGKSDVDRRRTEAIEWVTSQLVWGEQLTRLRDAHAETAPERPVVAAEPAAPRVRTRGRSHRLAGSAPGLVIAGVVGIAMHGPTLP